MGAAAAIGVLLDAFAVVLRSAGAWWWFAVSTHWLPCVVCHWRVSVQRGTGHGVCGPAGMLQSWAGWLPAL